MTAAVQARRRGRNETPRWAEQYPDTPEGMDAMHAMQEARRLPDDTDPDTIEDPAVREAFLERLMHEEEHGTPGERAGGSNARGGARNGRGARRQANPSYRRPRGRQSRKAYTPTLRPPSSLSASDGTGFALGLLLTAIGLNYLRYGKAGVKAWFLAKFLNRANTLGDQRARERSYRQGLHDTRQLLLDPLKPGRGRRMDEPPLGFPGGGG